MKELDGRKTRIMHVIARMNMGGTAVYLSNLVTGLEKLGIENLLVIGSVPPGEIEDSVVETLPIRRISAMSRAINFFSDHAARKELDLIIREFEPDLIHSHTFKAGAIVRSKRQKVPVVHTFHGHHLYDPEFGFLKRRILNKWERVLAKRSDAIVTIGERVKRELLAAGIGSEPQYVSIAPGIDGIKLASVSKIKKVLGLTNEERPIVIWLGRFTKVKRPDRVIKLALEKPGYFFVMAGGGELIDSIRASAPSNVLVTGWQKKEEMLAIADVALSTSDSEGMPLALIEAQMAGIPVVSTNVGSVDEIVIGGVTGMLGNSDTELIAGLDWVMNQQKTNLQKSKFSKKIKKLAHTKFEKEIMVSAHRDLYRKLGV